MRQRREAMSPPRALAGDALPQPFAPAHALIDAMAGGSAEARRDLAAGRARLVIAGQQPCFPLPLGLTLQKAATAVALSRRLSERSDYPVYPLFWSGADDSDFEEARGQRIARERGAPLQVSLNAGLQRKGAQVGDLPVAPAFDEYSALPMIPTVDATLMPMREEDLGAHQQRLLAGAFAPWRLFVLDARCPALREAAIGLYLRYAERRAEFSKRLDRAGDQLELELGRRPLRRGLGERALFFLRRGRRLLPPPREYGEELERRLAAKPGELSPNASLRPLIQDAVLPVAAAVLGPAEWDYHTQLRAPFELMEIPFPAAWPRLRANWAGDAALGLDDEGRRSSPWAWPGHPLADVQTLVDLADEHLEAWSRGEYTRLHLEGNELGG